MHYHLDKANKVADMLSRKSAGSLMSLMNLPKQLRMEIIDFELRLINERLAALYVQPLLLNPIKEEQQNDEKFSEIINEVRKKKREVFYFGGRWNANDLQENIHTGSGDFQVSTPRNSSSNPIFGTSWSY